MPLASPTCVSTGSTIELACHVRTRPSDCTEMENREAAERVDQSMPQLALEVSLRGKRALGRLLGVHGPTAPEVRQLADGYVRLVEKTILEYQAARERLLAFVSSGFADDYYRAQDQFESSAHSLHRAIEYLDRLRKRGFRKPDGSQFVPRPRELEVLREGVGVRSTIRNFRDRAEHLDEDIVSGRLPPGSDVAIQLGWDRASIGGVELIYADVVRCIEQLHHFAALLSRVQIIV